VRRRQLAAAALAFAACGVLSPEEQLLRRFFEAARLHDTTVVSSMSDVMFNPRTDGVVREFDLIEVRRDGDAADVTMDAVIATPDGELVGRVLRVRLQQRNGRWFIVNVS
jgi:hypothetical protein